MNFYAFGNASNRPVTQRKTSVTSLSESRMEKPGLVSATSQFNTNLSLCVTTGKHPQKTLQKSNKHQLTSKRRRKSLKSKEVSVLPD